MIKVYEQWYILKNAGHSDLICHVADLKGKTWYANSWVCYLGSLSKIERACAADTKILIFLLTHFEAAKPVHLPSKTITNCFSFKVESFTEYVVFSVFLKFSIFYNWRTVFGKVLYR